MRLKIIVGPSKDTDEGLENDDQLMRQTARQPDGHTDRQADREGQTEQEIKEIRNRYTSTQINRCRQKTQFTEIRQR